MNKRNARNAFTLVELMIVIVIIAILAGLTTVGTRIAIRKSKEATVTLALEQLSMALDRYKNEIGEYPPDFTDLEAVTRHVRKRWPRCGYADDFFALAAANNVFDWDVTTCGPASALVFWLGGIPDANGKPGGFFLSPTDPLCINPGTSTQREEPRYDFPDGTIAYGAYRFDRIPKGSVVPETVECTGGPAFQPGKDDAKPVVYFCASAPAENTVEFDDEGAREICAYQLILCAVGKYCAFKRLGRAVPYAKKVGEEIWTWHEPNRFQLIHPGQDGLFNGEENYSHEEVSPYPYYPYPCTGNGRNEEVAVGYDPGINKNNLTKEDDDNIVNFAEGGTLESLYPEK